MVDWLGWEQWLKDSNYGLTIIGLISYNTRPGEIHDSFDRWNFAVHVLAYVAYLNLSVFTKRQMEDSKGHAKYYETEDYDERSMSVISALS